MVILVDENDVSIGMMPKLEAHRKAALHRAFSVFIFNTKEELLLQRRAINKYHSGGLWTNTCCSHPRPDQEVIEAAHERLMFEMGLNSELKYLFKFKYISPFDNNLTEHEIDHVYIGFSDELPCINPDEVSEYKYVGLNELQKDILDYPFKYTSWFRIIFENFLAELSIFNFTK